MPQKRALLISPRNCNVVVVGVVVLSLCAINYIWMRKVQAERALVTAQDEISRLKSGLGASQKLIEVEHQRAMELTMKLDQLHGSGGGGGSGADGKIAAESGTITVPVLVMACCRVEYLDRTLKHIMERIPRRADGTLGGEGVAGGPSINYEIIVSQDGGHSGVQDLMRNSYPKVKHLVHIDDRPLEKDKPHESDNYYKIARHYGWALQEVFGSNPAYDHVIILEDDLEISPDFFEYMAFGVSVLKLDPTLWTVTAWNDNGFAEHAESGEVVLRSDFFGGLGWIMTRTLWTELGPKWPRAYWDDWMREPPQRRGRACLRPEISRTVTFGKIGSSNGQFFESHLARIALNNVKVDFASKDKNALVKSAYDPAFLAAVEASPVVNLGALGGLGPGTTARIMYGNQQEFKEVAGALHVMDDEKAGVPRTGYLGVVTLRLRRGRDGQLGPVLYIAPRGGKPLYSN